MTARDQKPGNKTSSDGMRYPAKKPGPAFGAPVLGSSSTTMSCFKRGRYKLLSELSTKKIQGRNQKACAVSCQARI
ncbi:hypothetical protein [Azohydromonas australica]|uniref:hypothetical protein n=1 Tax=Azohydromonas australica TaxID=364039 RepID=UPI00048E0E65|nr:hypothetical protein [Azohydromonas australica]